jgi:small subunit ribosomal protein S9
MTTESERYYYGTGKRKTAIARVRLYPGGDSITVNGKPVEEALPWAQWRQRAKEPFKVAGLEGKFTVVAKIHGGGVAAHADALRHGIARALLVADPELRKTLREQGMLTRDARVKERKKYGLKGARRAPQYTKR